MNVLTDILMSKPKCYDCGEILTTDNYKGWFDIIFNPFGIAVEVPLCNDCIVKDDGLDSYGAY